MENKQPTNNASSFLMRAEPLDGAVTVLKVSINDESYSINLDDGVLDNLSDEKIHRITKHLDSLLEAYKENRQVHDKMTEAKRRLAAIKNGNVNVIFEPKIDDDIPF